MIKQLKSIKTQLIIFLVCFAVFLSIRDKDGLFLIKALIAVIFAISAEAAIIYYKTKALRVTESSIITGLIIGYVLSAGQPWWKFLLVAVLAISSKHLIRFKGRHIFNPAAFGVFGVILLGASTQWNGAYYWYLLLPFGLYFAHKIKKIEVLIGYCITALSLFGIQALLQNVPPWHIFSYLNYFYIFVMVIEPKTTPIKPQGKFIFGAGTALLIFALIELGVRFDAELFSLLVMNSTVGMLNKIAFKGGRV